MAMMRVAAERLIPAPAAAVYALLADYREGHPSILPPAFTDFTVLEGGVGAGTVIRFRLKAGGRVRETEARVAEPEPGRVLTETYPETGAVTTFTVEPAGDDSSRLTIETTGPTSAGLRGLIERFLTPRVLRPLYDEELDLIERWAASRKDAHQQSSR